ncbi:endonuclease/exonuclease/phosphatase family protein [Porphyromonas pogonae]|uniref:endonuclease/exonuclease/phosphatase family protein n=1 Tax=Porphyromonas pogonae TaxID=867595 RepID=UPI002E78761F|nr:endonuclease/exonuclease/phosphatase family protein [Porphyromonas pogonae]
MKNRLLSFLLFLFVITSLQAQDKAKYAKVTVAFYNLENLFDTIDGPNKDEEFLPNGANAWTEERYREKLHHMASVISQIGSDKGPDIIGVCEIENIKVLEDLIAQPELKGYGYSIVHYDSPDARGIDCALLYKVSVFKLLSSKAHAVNIPGEPNVKTRDVLEASGTILGDKFHFLVAHWPSRAGGEQISLNRRMAAARVMKSVSDSVVNHDASAKVILMGDFNDDPVSPSIKRGLQTKDTPENLAALDLFNPMTSLYRKGIGTLAYRDVWNLFDNLVVNGNLIGSDYTTFKVLQDKKSGEYAHVFNSEFLRQQRGHFKGYPFRTFAGGQYQGGYSDHFPVYLYIVKKI